MTQSIKLMFRFFRILNVVALSSEDFKTWLNGLQLILHLGTERSLKVRIREIERLTIF